MLKLFLSTILIASIVIFSGCTKEDNKPEDLGRTILFVSNRDGNDEIYAMREDSTDLIRLTSNTVPDGRATWSADGKFIAFASGTTGTREIVIMEANGQNLRNLSNTPAADEDWPEWSPIGNRITFSSNRDGNHEIYIVNFDGTNPTKLTNRTQDDKWPTFSPDGNKIAFHSLMGAGNTDVFVMNADGSTITQLTTTTALDQMPTWSPDGKKIAFMSSRDANPEVYIMNADGSSQAALTSTPAIDARPAWGRKTNKIIFTSGRDFATPSTLPSFEIYMMNADGTNPLRLTRNNFYDDYPYIK
jgi:TolB protein